MQDEQTQQLPVVKPKATQPSSTSSDSLLLSLDKLEQFWHSFRRISPLVIPASLFCIFLMLVGVLNIHSLKSVQWTFILPVLFVFASVALLQASALLYAPNDALWAVSVACGFLIFLFITLVVILGWQLGSIVIVLLNLIAWLLFKSKVHTVTERTVHVMVLFGKYNRTLLPGFNLCFPGERLLAILPTSESFHTCAVQRIYISPSLDIELAATISYQLIPEEAHRAVLNIDDWESRLHHLLEMTLQDVVNEFVPEAIATTKEGNKNDPLRVHRTQIDRNWIAKVEGINKSLSTKLQYKVRNWGILINWVKVHDLVLLEQGGGIGLQDTYDKRGATSSDTQIPDNAREEEASTELTSSFAPVTVHSPSLHHIELAESSAKKSSEEEIVDTNVHSSVPLQAMVEVYDAIRDGRINNAITIRTIAHSFESYAKQATEEDEMPFDFMEASVNLRRRAAMVEAHTRSRTS